MCLSTVYEVRDGSENKLCECVSSIEVGDGNVTMTDIMGQETVVKGTIVNIDLVKNIILIKAAG